MAIYLFSQILKFTQYRIKLIKKLSRRHLINSSDVFVIKGFTVNKLNAREYHIYGRILTSNLESAYSKSFKSS